jgi:hypothetical protein
VPILRDFERRLGSLVEGFFATTFRSGLQPVELAKRLMREMDASRTVGCARLGPRTVRLLAVGATTQAVRAGRHALVAELRQVVREAAERGWGWSDLRRSSSRWTRSSARVASCVASFVEGEELALQPVDGEPMLVLSDGRAIRLTEPTLTIGRLPGATWS